MRPARVWWMVSPAPQASTRATASPGPGTGSGTVSRTNGESLALSTIAFMPASPASGTLLFRARFLELPAQGLDACVVFFLAFPVAVRETPAAAGGADTLARERFPEFLAFGFHLAQRRFDVDRAVVTSAAGTLGFHPPERLRLPRSGARNAFRGGVGLGLFHLRRPWRRRIAVDDPAVRHRGL